MVDARYIWFDGKLLPWGEANVHVLAHSLHYGLGVFEGIRCYRCQDGRSAIFRLPEHIRRLRDSAHVAQMPLPFSQEEMERACLDTLRANGQVEAYLRPLAFIGAGKLGIHPQDNPIHVAVATWVWGAYLGEEGLRRGIRAKVSSFSRHHPNVMMTKAKICGNYVNSIMAKLEVTRAGYDEAILLDPDGYVAEATGENIFIVRDGRLKTPPLTSVLPGITRETIIHVAKDMGLDVVEQRFTRDELYIADEAFFTGTAAEVTPIREVDDRAIGRGVAGELTLKIQERYFQVVKGGEARYGHWLTYLGEAEGKHVSQAG
ncbi:MAG: branched-chain amino acid transaminase [Pseudomonadota bacterium]